MKIKYFFILTVFSIVGYIFVPLATAGDNNMEHFVTRDGRHLVCDGKPFYFNSANNDHVYHWSHFMIDDQFNDASALGCTAFRTWASSEGQGSWKDGYCFQPNPGVYDENTFKQMDYIIAKATEKGIRLILPLVNNWDDGYGGMPQYVRWARGDAKDWSGKTILKFDIYNDGDAGTVDVSFRTGNGWTWHESQPVALSHGWNYNITYDLTSSTWKTEASGWKYTSQLGERNFIQSFGIGVFGYTHPGSVYIDNIRLDGQLYDGLEMKGPWYAADYSYARGVEISTAYVSEGAHSLRMSYVYSSGEYNKAFAEQKPEFDKNIFFTDQACKTLYKQYISYFLNRVNTVTGIAYKNDPAILMWELANEPRCESDPSGDVLQAWIEEMSTYIKQIDPNHLVSTGEEGWYNTPGASDWRDNGELGADFVRNNQAANVDICSFHMYPEGYGMSREATLDWINEHIYDAHGVVGKPVYLGEFGITYDRKAVILNDFDATTENWSIDWNCSSAPAYAASPSKDGNGSMSFTANIGTVNTSSACRVIYPDPGVDYSGYDYFTGWVYVPSSAPSDLTAEMYIRTGTGWTWASGTSVSLNPGQWTQVKLTNSQVWNWGADMSAVRCIGIQVKRANTDYNGAVNFDVIGANVRDIYDAAYQFIMRNDYYSDWLNMLDALDADGAGFWQLFSSQDSGELFPDWWNWGVYCPEDVETSDIMQNFSKSMKYKSGDIEGPMLSARLNAGNNEDLLICFGPRYGSWVYYDNSEWRELHKISPKIAAAGNIDGDVNGQDDLVLDLGAQYGLWLYYNNAVWVQLHGLSAESVTIADLDNSGQDDIVVDFGYKYGVWIYHNNSFWTRLHSISSMSITKADLDSDPKDDLIVDFGGRYGIWIRYNNVNWAFLHPESAEDIVSGDMDNNGQDDIVVDFGSQYGMWVFFNNSSWIQFHGISPRSMAAAFLDHDMKADIVVDFGEAYGIWIYANNNIWFKLTPESADAIIKGDTNGNGIDELIVDFGNEKGVRIFHEDGSWAQLHTVSP